jgi:hypothetical protein
VYDLHPGWVWIGIAGFVLGLGVGDTMAEASAGIALGLEYFFFFFLERVVFMLASCKSASRADRGWEEKGAVIFNVVGYAPNPGGWNTGV